jgi:hypothetical protein
MKRRIQASQMTLRRERSFLESSSRLDQNCLELSAAISLSYPQGVALSHLQGVGRGLALSKQFSQGWDRAERIR